MTPTANAEIRAELQYYSIPYWKVSSKIGISEMTVQRWLRTELNPERKQKIENALEEIKAEMLEGLKK